MELKLYCTFHSPELYDEYNLKNDEIHTMFPSYDLDIDEININYANPVLCEFVTMYYVWKNCLYSQFVGFEHYRRKFDKQIPELNNNQCYVMDLFLEDKKIKYVFCDNHYSHIYNICLLLLKYKYKYIDLYNAMNNTTKFIPYNCFIMSYNNFEKMCECIFPILFDLDNIYDGHLNVDNYLNIFYDNYQARQLAFLGERLISCYILTHFNTDNILIEKELIEKDDISD